MTLYDQFINEVETGILLSNTYVKKAVKRFLNDIELSKKKDSLYIFDTEKADKAIGIVKMMKHTTGDVANQNFILKPYQAFIIANIFGWVRKDTGKRRFRRVYVEIARKGVKSELAAAVALIMLIFDNEYGAQVFTTATNVKQANVVFEKAVSMIRKLQADSPRIKQTVDIMGKTKPYRIFVTSTESYMESWSSDSGTKDGFASHCTIVDEYHAWDTDGMIGVAVSSSGFRSQPLLFIITTAGFNKQSPCYAERDVAVNILDGIYENDTYFTIIFTLDAVDDWNDKSLWIKSCPNIGETPRWDYMEAEYLTALEGVSKEINFKTKNLNIWTNTHSTWIQDSLILEIETELDLKDFKNRVVIPALDLSSSSSGDLSALVLLFEPIETDPTIYIYPIFFVSSEKINGSKRADGVDYRQWHRDGYIIEVEGNTMDYKVIENKVYEIANEFQLKVLPHDVWNSSELINNLVDAGINTYQYSQFFKAMNYPTTELEKYIKERKIKIHKNPAMRWMFSNVILRRNSDGWVKIDKEKSKDKVDGCVALVMAFGMYLELKANPQTYNGLGPVVL